MSPRTASQNPRLPFDEPEPAGAGLPDAADRAAAVDPAENVVLEASAGTGKTRVLVDRYTNLLKRGVDPANILAITFTRKAAAEMRERILHDVRQAAELGEIDPARWRSLRDRLGEIAISTIDAFCLALLREFPLEADLDPGFTMADETEVLRLMDEALDRALRICRHAAMTDASVGLVFAQLGDRRLRGGLAALLERRLVARDALRRFLVHGPADLTPEAACRAAAERLRDTLRSVEGGLASFLADGPIHHPRFAMLARDIQDLVSADLGSEEARPLLLHDFRRIAEELRDHFLTQGGEPRTRWRYKGPHCDSDEAWKRHRQRATRLAPRVAGDLARFQRDLNVVVSHGVWRVFEIVLREYRRTLEAHAVVDFPDALWRTLDLLREMDEFAQSRYLLEARYHHLLVDEFQDTSQAQWELVWRLVEAWGQGLGLAADAPLPPSIFIVGDRKQSIYGFRDADVGVLARAASAIAGLRGQRSVRRAIRKSFRAVPALLSFTNDLFEAVEKVASRDDAFEYGETDRFPVEQPAPAGAPALGLVFGPDGEACAAAVADEIADLMRRVTVRDRQTGLARPVEPGDIAILFRAREGHQAFEIALEARGIPSYVYKGLGFFDTDEIKDVFALLRYLADPASNLRAAALLRSRFVRLSDPALQMIAPRIADALRMRVPGEDDLGGEDLAVLRLARESIARWLALVDVVPPAEVLDRVLDDTAYLTELRGPRVQQARENLKKVRALVRRIQNRGYATLARVAAHLDRLSAGDESNAAIDAADAVSLMTVHAAKGLEFPVIFLVNLGRGTGGSRAPIRLVADDGSGQPSVAVGDYIAAADDDLPLREKEEAKRLLYVAVTRARDRLYLSAPLDGDRLRLGRTSLGAVLPQQFVDQMTKAALGSGDVAEWRVGTHVHRMRVRRAAAATPNPADGGFREGTKPGSNPAGAGAGQHGGEGSLTNAGGTTNPVERGPHTSARPSRGIRLDPELPAYDLQPLTNTGTPRRPAARLGSRTGAPLISGEGSSAIVGTLVHRLFEHHAARRDDSPAAVEQHARALMHAAGVGSESDAEAVIRTAVRLFDDMRARPQVLEALGGERLHEVPVTLVENGQFVQGTIDLLVRRGDRVTVVEFKTGQPAPEHEEQVRTYLSAARALFPEAGAIHGLLVYRDRELWIS
jgi:ATP-dependent helicase/nuclease subunit A